MPYIGTCFRFYMQMRVQKTNKAFAYRIYSHFTQQCMKHLSQKSVSVHLPSQSTPTILALKNWVGWRTWKNLGWLADLKKTGCKKTGSGFFFVIQKKKRQPELFSFRLQIASRKNMVQTLKKIWLMQPYIF